MVFKAHNQRLIKSHSLLIQFVHSTRFQLVYSTRARINRERVTNTDHAGAFHQKVLPKGHVISSAAIRGQSGNGITRTELARCLINGDDFAALA
jgi:hypothetical protein